MLWVDALTNVAVVANKHRRHFGWVVGDEAGAVRRHVPPLVRKLPVAFSC